MYELYLQGYDLVCGSRYMPGGKLIGGPFFKQLLSRTSGLTLHYFRGIPTHDATNSFKLYDARMVHELKVESVAGFELGLELTVKAFLNGYRIAEIPSVWRDRTAGTSRFRVMHWMPHYLKWYFHAFRPKSEAGAKLVQRHRSQSGAPSSPPACDRGKFRKSAYSLHQINNLCQLLRPLFGVEVRSEPRTGFASRIRQAQELQ